jgi:predicted tellurium resistance membrane protein TerC
MEIHLLNFDTIFAFLTLTALEIALGIDNIIFISVLSNRLPRDLRNRARRYGLLLALVTRIILLIALSWVISLNHPIFTIFGRPISGKKLLLFSGGLFLLWKAAREIYLEVEAPDRPAKERNFQSSAITNGATRAKLLWATVVQIGLLDVIFSLDSVITAVGLVNQIPIMISAILASIAIMLIAAQAIGDFVYRHPSIKLLALSFLIVVGVVLISEGMDVYIPRSYVYFAMAFSLLVELLAIRSKSKKQTYFTD